MDDLIQALDDYVDARIQYAEADPEWRSAPMSESDRVAAALDRLITDRVAAALVPYLGDGK